MASPLPASPVYLDYFASAPVDPRVVEEMMKSLTFNFGNPTSAHSFGQKAMIAVEEGRSRVASLMGCAPENIVFTSGGSECNSLAIIGGLKRVKEMHPERDHVICTLVEHSAVLSTVNALEGYRVTRLGVDENGTMSLEDLKNAIEPGKTAMVTVMLANNEVGSIQPIKEIVELCKEHDIIVHTDAAQAVGKIPINAVDLGVDMLSIAGHKIYGPKGVGALYCKGDFRPKALILGAGQEAGLRSGTHNVPGISGFGKAAELCEHDLKANHHLEIQEKRDYLQAKLLELFPDARVNALGANRIPTMLSIGIPGVKGFDLLIHLQDRVCFSAGAACSKGKGSRTLSAMNVPIDHANGTIRLSLGRFTTQGHVDEAIAALKEAVAELRAK